MCEGKKTARGGGPIRGGKKRRSSRRGERPKRKENKTLVAGLWKKRDETSRSRPLPGSTKIAWRGCWG